MEFELPQPQTPRRPVDMHVHMVGNGMAGSGCWLRVRGWHHLMAGLMLRGIGLPSSALTGNLESLYLAGLLEQLRSSSIGAAVILAQDLVYDERGEPINNFGSFYVPNDFVLQLAKMHAELLPAVSIHPARPDALEELERCLSAGAVMMKCLPNCQNINCNDRHFPKFWERMAEAKLPLLAHTGGEHTVPVFCRDYADPRILELPLECGVTTIAAHCATKSGLFDPEYFDIFSSMTRRFPNLYGDISAFNVPIRGRHVSECLREPIVARMVHGSDYPVPVHGHFAWMRGTVDWKTFRRWERQSNIIERDYQLKLAMGFPEQTFTRIWDLLRLPIA